VKLSFALYIDIYVEAFFSSKYSRTCAALVRAKTARGARAFGVVAPRVWHDLPDYIRSSDSITSSKNNLKTYLFNQASPS